MVTFNASSLVELATKNGGFTLSLVDGKPITWTHGYMVSHSQGESIVSLSDLTDISSAVESIQAGWDSAQRPDGWYLGGWVNDGKLYIDLSQRISGLDRAVVAARQRQQLAIYNLLTGEELITSGKN